MDTHKLLGIHLDNHLTWNIHIDKLCNKVKSRLFLFRKIKYLLPLQARMQFFEGYVQPLLDYGCIIWGNTSRHNLKRLHTVVKQFGRSILDIKNPKDIHTVDLFKTLDWLPIDTRIRYFKGVMAYKAINNLTPVYLSQMFTLTQQIHQYQTRQSTNKDIYMPNIKTEYGRRSYKYWATIEWNMLPHFVKDSPSLPVFKKRYMLYLKTNIYVAGNFPIDA